MSAAELRKVEARRNGAAGSPVANPLRNGNVATGNKLRRLDLADLAGREPEPIPWLVEDFAAKGELTMVFGIGGVAKSLTLMALSNGVIHGEEVAGIDCYQGRCCYFDAENGEREIHRRVKGLGLSSGLALYEVNGLNLNDPDDLAAVESAILAEKAELVVFDSLRTLLPGVEENDSGDMSKALTALRGLAQRHDFAGVVIHHADKLGRTFRGSSAIRDQVSLSFKLGRQAGDPDRRRRYLDTDKCRIADDPERRWFRLVIEPPAIYIEAAEAPDPESKEPPRERKYAPEVLALFEGDRSASKTLSEVARGIGVSPTNGTVRRVLDDLVEQGRLSKNDHDYALPPADDLGNGKRGNGKPRPRPGGPTTDN